MPALSALNLSRPTTSTAPSNLTSTPPKKMDNTKKFLCSKCGACFTQIETFKRHINFYCKGGTLKTEDNLLQSETASHPHLAPSTMTPNRESNGSGSASSLADLLAALQQQNQRQNASNQMQHSLLDPSFGSNTIILPVAHHNAMDQALIQIIGPPQTVIPVAIGRVLPAISRPLLLDGNLVHSLQLPTTGRVPINSIAPRDFNLPLAFIQPWSPLSLAALNTNASLIRPFAPNISTNNLPSSTQATATATVTSLNALSPSLICATVNKQRARSVLSTAPPTPSKRRCTSASDKPLDLTITSKNVARSNESEGSSSETMDTEAEKVLEKKFACECGVAFLSADTLTSHRKYYCRNRVIDETEEQELTRKVPSRCSQCDYIPATHAQLSQHMRHKHCAVQAYVCLLCGYKGYSARGIKNHLRSSHADEMARRKEQSNGDEKMASTVLSDKSLLQDYVFCVTDKTQQMACQKCRSTFPTDTLLQNHNCPAERKSHKQINDNQVDANQEESLNGEDK